MQNNQPSPDRRHAFLMEKVDRLRRNFRIAALMTALTAGGTAFVATQQDYGELCDLHKQVEENVKIEMQRRPDANPQELAGIYRKGADDLEDITRSAGLMWTAFGGLMTMLWHIGQNKAEKQLRNYTPPRPGP